MSKSDVLFQALVLSTRHQAVKDANLSGRNLIAIRDLLMRQYQQVGVSMNWRKIDVIFVSLFQH